MKSTKLSKFIIIFLLSVSIILQNTCLMGAAGQSVILRVLNKGCRMQCHLGCHLKRSSENGGVKTNNKGIEEKNKSIVCYFQFKAEDITTAIAVPITRQAYLGREDQVKYPFLDPPIKPPGASLFL